MEDVHSAVPLGGSSNYLSAHEFQSILSSWFEEKGIISELRSQLRFKMVNVLRNTVIGRDIGKKTAQRLSLSKQAVNLIVAEFLGQNKCHYSLSIFNAEVALSNILPEYSLIFENVPTKENDAWHFDKENVLNILELIGIAKTSIHSEELLSLYFNDQDNDSILSCLISLLRKLVYKDDKKSSNHDLDAELIDLQHESTFIKEVGNILLRSDLSANNLKAVLENIRSLYDMEIRNLEKEHSKVTKDLKMKTRSQETQIKEMQKTNKVLNNHFLKINKEYRKLKVHVKNLLSQGELLKQRYEPPNKNMHFSKTVNNNLKENESISRSSAIIKKQIIEICQLRHCTDICEENIRHVDKLSKENKMFREENNEQKEEIKKLSIKCKELLSKFTDCQRKINLLNCRINEGNSKELLNSFLYDDNLISPEVHLRENMVSSDVSSDSVTEEVLIQARLRLQKLEEESNDIEEKYRNFHHSTHSFNFD